MNSLIPVESVTRVLSFVYLSHKGLPLVGPSLVPESPMSHAVFSNINVKLSFTTYSFIDPETKDSYTIKVVVSKHGVVKLTDEGFNKIISIPLSELTRHARTALAESNWRRLMAETDYLKVQLKRFYSTNNIAA